MGEGACWRTYGQIAVLLTVLADFLLGDGHGLWGFRGLLGCLWAIASAVRLRCDGRRKGVGHGLAVARERRSPVVNDVQRVRIDREKSHGSNPFVRGLNGPSKSRFLWCFYILRLGYSPHSTLRFIFVAPVRFPVIKQDLMTFPNISCYRRTFQSAKDNDARSAFDVQAHSPIRCSPKTSFTRMYISNNRRILLIINGAPSATAFALPSALLPSLSPWLM